MTIFLDKQRPPKKRMGRLQRKGSKSNPRTGVQWANWLDIPGSGGGGGGGPVDDPHIDSTSPNSIAASSPAVDVAVFGAGFVAGSVIEFNQVARATTFLTEGYLMTTGFDPTVAGDIEVTVRNPNGKESNSVILEVQAAAADPTSSWTKHDIIAWLVDHGVIVDADAAMHFTKVELLAIVAAYLNDDEDELEELLS